MVETAQQWTGQLAPLVLLVGGFVVGFVLERVVLALSQRSLAEATPGVVEVVTRTLKWTTTLLVGMIGAGLALAASSLPSEFVAVADDVLFALGAAIVTVMVMRLSVGVLALWLDHYDDLLPATSIVLVVVRVVVITIGVLIVLEHLGISIAPILAAAGVGGIALALGLQDTLSSLFAGLQIIAGGEIRTGDYVQLESGEEGRVIDIRWRSTTIRTIRDNVIIVPNSVLAKLIVRNYRLSEEELSIVVDVGVSYASDLEHVERVAQEVAREVMEETEAGVSGFEPAVRFHAFGDSSVDLRVILRVRTFTDQYALRSEFVKRLHRRFEEEGIVIPFPMRTVQIEGMERLQES